MHRETSVDRHNHAAQPNGAVDLAALAKRACAERLAFLLDFDGTLAEIAPQPEAVVVTDETRATLARLVRATGGAVAIITGRDIGWIDARLAPLVLPAAGIHGLQRRNAAGYLCCVSFDPMLLDEARAALELFARTKPGLVVEQKSMAVAVHCRARPELMSECLAAADQWVAHAPGLVVTRGKLVVEIRPGGSDKGTAVAAIVQEPPFAGRTPLFAGDDATDEDAIAVVNAMDGITVKIGAGATAARYRAGDTAGFLTWLASLARHIETRRDADQ